MADFWFFGFCLTGLDTWLDCAKNDMESLDLSKRMHSSETNAEEELRGQPANPGSPGKMAI